MRAWSSIPSPRRGVHTANPGRAGFSMIELLGVIVVMGLIAGIVSVNWRAILPKAELHTAVRELAATLEGARSDAIARSATFQVHYDLDQHRYRVITPFRLGGGFAMYADDRHALAWVKLPDTVRFARIVLAGDDYATGSVYVAFDALGTASGHTVVFVQKPEDNFYTIDVMGLLGLITYSEGQVTRVPPKESDFQ